MTARLLAAIVALAAAVDAASDASQCAAVKTCYMAGDASMPCVVTEEDCPPCMLFDGNSCFVRASGSCPFGTDCTGIFFSGSSGSSSISNSTTTSNSTKDSSTSGTADTGTTSLAGTSRSHANSAGGSSSETELTDSGDSGSSTILIVAIVGVAVAIAVLGVIVRKLFLRARAASEQNADQEEIPSPPATEMTASFSSNDTTRDAGAVVARSAIGTDLSESKSTSV